jgi:N-carbamoyl-L-amino-acid hydrolase
MSFQSMWDDLLPVGRLPRGGYRRFAWTSADMACREWFRAEAHTRGMDVETDRNGNLWAWLGGPGPDAFVTGSHLDSVPGGGAYDGPLGIVSAFAAIDALLARGSTPAQPIAVVAFVDEEGARFGVACLGSRLSIGAADPARTLALADSDGTRLAEAMHAQGQDRRVRRTARRAGAGARRPEQPHRARYCDLAARALAIRLPRRGQPRRYDGAVRPA